MVKLGRAELEAVGNALDDELDERVRLDFGTSSMATVHSAVDADQHPAHNRAEHPVKFSVSCSYG